jgi:hypothetical protein
MDAILWDIILFDFLHGQYDFYKNLSTLFVGFMIFIKFDSFPNHPFFTLLYQCKSLTYNLYI